MSVDYIWEVTSLKATNNPIDGLNEVVTQVDWKLTGTDRVNSYSVAGFSIVGAPESTDFVALKDLTEDTVLVWVKSIVDNTPGYLDFLASKIELELTNLANQTTTIQAPNLPWANK